MSYSIEDDSSSLLLRFMFLKNLYKLVWILNLIITYLFKCLIYVSLVSRSCGVFYQFCLALSICNLRIE